MPLYERLFSDQLTPVVAYRCLVDEDDHELPSLLFESVVKGGPNRTSHTRSLGQMDIKRSVSSSRPSRK